MRGGIIFIMICVVSLAGCNPRATVCKNPGPYDTGFRFYRPKPYLLVQPTLNKEDKYVSISLQYLPDFNEEYSVNVRTGLGSNNTTLKFKDGWNLTEVNQTLDSNFDDNVKAVGSLVDSVSNVLTEGGKPGQQPVSMNVVATNVPLGFYEAVIQKTCDGKRLAGWRYVGFSVFNKCTDSGCEAGSRQCDDQVFGLSFRNGVMVFENLSDIANRRAADVTTSNTPSSEAPDYTEAMKKITVRAIEIYNDKFGAALFDATEVSAELGDDETSIGLVFTLDATDMKTFNSEGGQTAREDAKTTLAGELSEEIGTGFTVTDQAVPKM